MEKENTKMLKSEILTSDDPDDLNDQLNEVLADIAPDELIEVRYNTTHIDMYSEYTVLVIYKL